MDSTNGQPPSYKEACGPSASQKQKLVDTPSGPRLHIDWATIRVLEEHTAYQVFCLEFLRFHDRFSTVGRSSIVDRSPAIESSTYENSRSSTNMLSLLVSRLWSKPCGDERNHLPAKKELKTPRAERVASKPREMANKSRHNTQEALNNTLLIGGTGHQRHTELSELQGVLEGVPWQALHVVPIFQDSSSSQAGIIGLGPEFKSDMLQIKGASKIVSGSLLLKLASNVQLRGWRSARKIYDPANDLIRFPACPHLYDHPYFIERCNYVVGTYSRLCPQESPMPRLLGNLVRCPLCPSEYQIQVKGDAGVISVLLEQWIDLGRWDFIQNRHWEQICQQYPLVSDLGEVWDERGFEPIHHRFNRTSCTQAGDISPFCRFIPTELT